MLKKSIIFALEKQQQTDLTGFREHKNKHNGTQRIHQGHR